MATYGKYTYPIRHDGDFTVPVAVSKPRKVFPFDSDPSVYLYEQDFVVLIDFYEPLQPSERHSTVAGLYYIKDTPISDIGGGVGKYTRTFSVLPGYDENGKKLSYVNSIYESFVWSVPGITTDQTLFLSNDVSSYSLSGGILTLNSSIAHDIVTGKGVSIYYTTPDPINNFDYYRYAERVALSAGGSSLTVREIKDVGAVQPISFKRSAATAEPYQKVVASRVDTDYWLVGVNTTSVDDIELIQPFAIIDNETGGRTEYLSETTDPSIDDFRDWAEEGRWIVAEGSVLRRWNSSDILERSTRYIKSTL